MFLELRMFTLMYFPGKTFPSAMAARRINTRGNVCREKTIILMLEVTLIPVYGILDQLINQPVDKTCGDKLFNLEEIN